MGPVERWLCGLAIAFGIYLRVFRFWKPSLWLDELATTYIASAPDFATLWQRARVAWEFPVHHLLTRFFLSFGHSELLVRLPSVVLGIASVFLLSRLLRRFTEVSGVLYASAIFALNSRFILYSQDGRMYALAVFLSLASVYTFLRILEGARWTWLASYAALTILLSYNQLLYTAVFAGQIFIAAVFYWRAPAEGRSRLRPLLLVQAAVVPLLIPLFLRLTFLAFSHTSLYSWAETPDWSWIRFVLTWPEVLYALVILPGAWTLWANRQKLRPRSDSERALLWLGLLYTAIWPAALTLAVLGVVNIVVPRYLLTVLLGIVFLTAFCVSRAGGLLLRATLGAYLVMLIYFEVATMSVIGNWLEMTYKQDWRAASAWIQKHYRPGDVVFVRSGFTQDRAWSPDEPEVQGLLTAALTGFYTKTPIAALGLPYSDLDLRRSRYAAIARDAGSRSNRIFALVDPGPGDWRWQSLERWLQGTDPRFLEIDRRSFQWIELRVYSRQIPQPD